MRHYGINGYIDAEATNLTIAVEEPLPRRSGVLLRSRTVELPEIAGSHLVDATRSITGSLQVDLWQMPGEQASWRRFTVNFDRKHRREFQVLHSWLANIVAINQQDSRPWPRIDPIENSVKHSQEPTSGLSVTQVPQSAEQRSQLVMQQPRYWEYRLFASVLVEWQRGLEPKWRDHELRYRYLGGHRLDDLQASRYLPDALNDASAIVKNIEELLSTENWTRAFGPFGQPGDAQRIEHMGARLAGLYEACLDWAATIRSARVSERFISSFDLAGQILDRAVGSFRAFIADFVEQIEALPGIQVDPRETIGISMTLTFSIDDALMSEFSREFSRAMRR